MKSLIAAMLLMTMLAFPVYAAAKKPGKGCQTKTYKDGTKVTVCGGANTGKAIEKAVLTWGECLAKYVAAHPDTPKVHGGWSFSKEAYDKIAKCEV